MNILFLSDVYFPRINGVSTSLHTLRAQLVEMGHRVQLVAPDYFSPSEDESWIMRIPSRYLPFDPEDRLMRYRPALARLSEHGGDYYIVHVHTPFVAHYLGLRMAKKLRVPCVETYHTFFEDYLHHYLPLLPRPMLRSVARSHSRRQCNAVAHAADKPVLLYVGRVAHEKNIGFLLRMTVQVKHQRPEVLLMIAGKGPSLEGLRRESNALGLQDNILFLGYLDRKTELNDCYRAADVFVFSSLTETQGLVLLEAMAQGVPVVAIAELGTRSILRDGVGALVAPAEESAFAARVLALLADRQQRSVLGAAAGEYALQWSARSMAERMAGFYRQVTAG